jgi:hypothetical protein
LENDGQLLRVEIFIDVIEDHQHERAQGFVKTHKKTPIYRAAHREPKTPGTSAQSVTPVTDECAGPSQ